MELMQTSSKARVSTIKGKYRERLAVEATHQIIPDLATTYCFCLIILTLWSFGFVTEEWTTLPAIHSLKRCNPFYPISAFCHLIVLLRMQIRSKGQNRCYSSCLMVTSAFSKINLAI